MKEAAARLWGYPREVNYCSDGSDCTDRLAHARSSRSAAPKTFSPPGDSIPVSMPGGEQVRLNLPTAAETGSNQ